MKKHLKKIHFLFALVFISIAFMKYGLFQIQLSRNDINYRFRFEGLKIYLVIDDTKFSNLNLIKHTPLHGLNITNTNVSDLSPLKGQKLNQLYLSSSNVTDLSPLKGMPIKSIEINDTNISDISALCESPISTIFIGNKLYSTEKGTHELVSFALDISNGSTTRKKAKKTIPVTRFVSHTSFSHIHNIEALKNIKTLQKINDYPVDNFIRDYKSGKFSIENISCLKSDNFSDNEYIQNCVFWYGGHNKRIDGSLEGESYQQIFIEDIGSIPTRRYKINIDETVAGIRFVKYDKTSQKVTLQKGDSQAEIIMGWVREI